MRFPINCNDSLSVWHMTANPITGSVRVRWFSNPTVQYKHTASRRAILSLLWHSKGSKGQWVNRHCLQRHSAVSV